MKTTSLTALVAAAGMLMGGSANAADLGGGCCADLEARVAELEATTARKGNRVVSLTVYGQVNKALLFWDNDFDSDTYVVDNDYSSSRFGFKGTATMRSGWTAGYNIEVDLRADANSNLVTVDNDEGVSDVAGELRIRVNEVYIESEQLGRVTIGQGSSATDAISEIVLANSYMDGELTAGASIIVNVLSETLGAFADDLAGAGRTDRVRYDSPAIYGFILSASWGEDDYYDVALRYKKEWNSIRLAAGIGYVNADELVGMGEFEQVSGSISIMHVPTGIYGMFAVGEKDFDDEALSDPNFWYAQLGVERRWFSHGTTTIYGEYGQYDGFTAEAHEADRWGLGIVQSIDSAAMDLYAQAQFWDFDDIPGADGELTTVMVGSIIKF